MRALRDLNVAVRHEVVLLVASDEEVGSISSRAITEEEAKRSECVLVLEPGTGFAGKLKTARKGVGEYTVFVKGKGAHAGVDFTSGASAIVEAARQISEIAKFTDLQRGITVNPGVISGGTGMGAPTENGFIHGLPTLDLLSLLVPRPFFEAVGTEDHGNVCAESKRDLPVEERMREKYEVYQILKEFYGIFTPENRAELFAFEGGHCFPSEARKAAYAFLKRHLQAA